MHRGDSRDYRPLIYGTCVVLFCTIAILINRRPIGDIILMIVGGLVVLVTAGYYIAQHHSRVRRKAEAEQSRAEELTAPWSTYSRPDGNDWVVGIERVGRQGWSPRFEHREMYRFPGGQPEMTERLDAEGDAIARAADFNARRTP